MQNGAIERNPMKTRGFRDALSLLLALLSPHLAAFLLRTPLIPNVGGLDAENLPYPIGRAPSAG